MTQDEIMELADKAGLAGYPDDLERFAKLVRENEFNRLRNTFDELHQDGMMDAWDVLVWMDDQNG